MRKLADMLGRDYLTMENLFSSLCEMIFMALIWKRMAADENYH